MIIGGVDMSTLDLDNSEFVLPEPVEGRVLNGDADIYCYNAAGYDDTIAQADVRDRLDTIIKTRMALAGATEYHLELTADDSHKGNRHDIACVKEYQGNRKGKTKPKHLAFARQYAKELGANLNHDQEADDGLAQFQQRYLDANQRNLCVLDSDDKDLRMVSGLHLDPYSDAIVDTDGYGSSFYDKEKSKVVGWGHSYFWHQLLMGDTADDIPGLPTFGGNITVSRFPSAPLTEALRRVQEGTMPSGKPLTDKQMVAAEAKHTKLMRDIKPRACGAVSAAQYLDGITNNLDAYKAVLEAYKSHYGLVAFDYTGWRGKTHRRTAEEMMIEQAVLLWMRRKPSIRDYLDFIQEVKNGQI